MILRKLKIIDLQFFLLILLPVAFVIGPFIVELIVNILIIFFIFNVIKNKNYKIFKNELFIFLLIFYLILLISLFNTKYFDETKINVIFYFRFILFPFAVFEILKANKYYFKILSITLLITVTIVAFDGFFQLFMEKI